MSANGDSSLIFVVVVVVVVVKKCHTDFERQLENQYKKILISLDYETSVDLWTVGPLLSQRFLLTRGGG